MSNVHEREDYEEVKVRKSKVIAGWSCESGMGVNTFLTAAAVETARRGFRTALVELDLFHASTAIGLGMSHRERNLEKWLEKSNGSEKYRGVRDFLLNNALWSNDKDKEDKELAAVVETLPNELYLLTPSQYMDRFQAGSLRLNPDMPYHIIEDLDSLDFQVIFIDLPSELLMPVTPSSLKLADEVIVFTDGQVSHNLSTAKDLKRISKELDSEHVKLVLNRAPKVIIPHVENTIGHKVWMTIPDDPSIIERSLDLIPGGGDDYNQVVKNFCDQMGFTKKKKAKVTDNISLDVSPEDKSVPAKGFRKLLNFARR